MPARSTKIKTDNGLANVRENDEDERALDS
jgi:hypothetical protein